jgi:hypothetical protein
MANFLGANRLFVRDRFDLTAGEAQFVKIDVKGTGDVVAALKEIPDKMVRKVFRKTMNTVVAPIYEAVVSSMPVHTGNLKNSIRQRVSISKAKGLVIGTVYADAKNDGGHANLIEEGFKLTAHKPTAKRGPYGHPRVLKRIKGQHLFRRALEQRADSTVSVFMTDVRELTREAQAKVGKAND